MGPSPTCHPPKKGPCETSVEHWVPLWAEPAEGNCSQQLIPCSQRGQWLYWGT